MDLDAIRTATEATLDPEWVRQYGAAAWTAALVLIGEPPPELEPPTPDTPTRRV